MASDVLINLTHVGTESEVQNCLNCIGADGKRLGPMNLVDNCCTGSVSFPVDMTSISVIWLHLCLVYLVLMGRRRNEFSFSFHLGYFFFSFCLSCFDLILVCEVTVGCILCMPKEEYVNSVKYYRFCYFLIITLHFSIFALLPSCISQNKMKLLQMKNTN